MVETCYNQTSDFGDYCINDTILITKEQAYKACFFGIIHSGAVPERDGARSLYPPDLAQGRSSSFFRLLTSLVTFDTIEAVVNLTQKKGV